MEGSAGLLARSFIRCSVRVRRGVRWYRYRPAEVDAVHDLAGDVTVEARPLLIRALHWWGDALVASGGYDPDFDRATHARLVSVKQWV